MMKALKPSGSYYGEFITSRADTGAATDADSTPTATATRNGTDDGTFSLTVTKIDTGRYKIAGTVPAYTAGDIVHVSVAATVNSVAGKGVVDEFVVVSGRAGIDDIPIEDAVLATSQPSYAPAKASDIPSSDITAILADTNELQAELADGGRTDLLIDAVKAKTDMQPVIWYSP